MPSKKVIYTFAVLFLVVAGWFWYLGRDVEQAPAKTPNTSVKPVNLPNEFITNWPIREGEVSTLLEQKYASGTKPKQLELSKSLVSHYTKGNLKTTLNTSSSTIETYGKDIVAALSPYALARENEVVILGKIYDTQDPKEISKLTKVYDLHQKALADFLAMRVPGSATEMHLQIVNDLYLLTKLTENMLLITTEPALALQSAQHYQLALISFYARLGNINDYFLSQGVTFSPENKINIFINTQ